MILEILVILFFIMLLSCLTKGRVLGVILGIVLWFSFWIGVICVAVHFITKYW